eukprot:883053-Rhodomonas_salina.2
MDAALTFMAMPVSLQQGCSLLSAACSSSSLASPPSGSPTLKTYRRCAADAKIRLILTSSILKSWEIAFDFAVRASRHALAM